MNLACVGGRVCVWVGARARVCVCEWVGGCVHARESGGVSVCLSVCVSVYPCVCVPDTLPCPQPPLLSVVQGQYASRPIMRGVVWVWVWVWV